MNKAEIEAKIESLQKKLENKNLADYHSDFRQAIKVLEGKLENLGQATVEVVKPITPRKPKTEKTPRTKTPRTPKTNVKKPATQTKSDLEQAKAEIKKATGKTEEECEAIIEQYKALRAKSQERKKKEDRATEKNKDRVEKLKKDDKLIPTTTEKNAPAVIETAVEEIPEKIEKEMEVIADEAKQEATKEIEKTKPDLKPSEKKDAIKVKTEEKSKVKVERVIERVTVDTSALLKVIAESLGKFDKDSQKEFLIKLRSDIDKLLSSFSYGGLTDGGVQVMNIQQSNLSSSSVNPTMFSGGGKIEYNEYGVPKGYLYLSEFANTDRKATGKLTDVSATVLEDNLLEDQSEEGQQIHAYLHDLPHFIEYENEIQRQNPESPENDEPMTDNYLLFLPIEDEDEAEENGGVPFHTFFIDTQGYDYPRYITRLVNYFPSDYQTQDLGYMAKGARVKSGDLTEEELYEWAKKIDDKALLSWCGYSSMRDFEDSSDLIYTKKNLVETNFEDLEYVYNNPHYYGIMARGARVKSGKNLNFTKYGDGEYRAIGTTNYLYIIEKGSGANYFLMVDGRTRCKGTLKVCKAFANDIENKKMARGGMTEHGLKINDRIAFDLNTINKKENRIVVSDEKGKSHYVDLDKGKRYSHGGNINKNHKI